VRDGIVTSADLELAIAERRPLASDPALARALSLICEERRPVNLGRAWEILEPLMSALESCAGVQAVEAAGGIRRSAPLVHSLIVAIRASNPARAVECLVALPIVTEVLHRTPRRAVVLFEGHEIDLRIAPPDEYGTLLFTSTGPAGHVAGVQKRRGPRLSASETEVYTSAGLAYLPPETRDAPDALEVAQHKTVPRLVEREDIRGDLHMHTTYSDGRDSLRRMLQASHALGYEYVAITDHSEHSAASRTLTPSDLERQADEIASLRHEFPGMTILHGIEVDIVPDGSLDCADAHLEPLDIVLASLHESAGQDGATLTRRCLAAIHHPLVSVITHPANQLVGNRAGYDMDYAAIYAAAAATGTALEIDGAPVHLDLDGDRARDAVRAGVTVVIDSDSHRARVLDRQMRMGLGTARRGWVEPRAVLNTRPLGDVRAFLAAKRNRRKT